MLTEYRGLTVAQLTQLRRSLGRGDHLRGREEHAGQACRDGRGHRRPRRAVHRSYRARLRLRRRRRGGEGPARVREGQPAARHQGRCLRGQGASPRPRSRKLADLESREVLLAKLAGAMKAQPEQGRGPVPGAAVQDRPPGGRPAGQAREGDGGRGGLRPPRRTTFILLIEHAGKDASMAKLSTDELLDAFKEMTLIELSEFVKQFEETFEVTAAAPVAMAGGRPGAPPRPRPSRGEGRVRRRPRGRRRQEDPGHQGRA